MGEQNVSTISVIVPCFNYGRYLHDAINSLVGGATCLGEFSPQTYQNFDIWIIDDASTDDTDAIARGLVNERIHYIHNESNIGTAATLNRAITQAGGKYITFLSADDMMETTRLEKLYAAMISSRHRIIYDDIRVFDGKQRTDNWPMPSYDFDRVLYKNTLHAGILYPKEAWAECGGYPEAFKDGREDWAFGVALGAKGWCGAHVKEALYLYRREGQNRSLKTTGHEWRMTFLGRMQATFPDLYRGERPAMCCGKKNTTAPSRAGAQSKSGGIQQMTIGEEGMTLLEYQLPKAGSVIYTGAVTRQPYAFSSIRKRGYVDSRDARALLDRIEDRRHAFIEVKEPEPNVPAQPLESAPTIAPVEQEVNNLVITETVPQPEPEKPARGRPRKAKE